MSKAVVEQVWRARAVDENGQPTYGRDLVDREWDSLAEAVEWLTTVGYEVIEVPQWTSKVKP